MCEHHNKRNAAPIQERLDNIRRPMRYASKKTEPIARRTFVQVSREWLKFVDAVARSLPDSKGAEFDTLEPEQDGISLKDLTPGEIDDINRQFDQAFGRSVAADIKAAANAFIQAVVGASAAAQISTNSAILDVMYFATIIAAGEEAGKLTAAQWALLPASLKPGIRYLPGEYVYNPELWWVKQLHRNGYELVASSLTKQFLPQIKRDIFLANGGGDPMATIARNIRNKYGGKLWHWERLVRTEMASAIDRASTERYRELGVGFEKWSLGHDACPICSGIRNTVNLLDSGDPDRGLVLMSGVWKIGEAPQVAADTHPNCRCFTTPLFRI